MKERIRTRGWTLAGILLATGLVSIALAGPGEDSTSGSGTEELASQVNDPTAPLSLVQFRDLYAARVPGDDAPANLFEIQPVLPVARSRYIPFDQLIKVTLPAGTAPGPGGPTGLGDIEVFDIVAITQSWGRWGLGPVLVLPTASSDELGQGKWQIGPAAAVVLTAVKRLQAGAVFQNPISFAGSSRRESVSALSITPTLTYNHRSGWFGGYSDFDLVFDWRDGEATIPLGLQVGKVFKLGRVPLSFSVEGAYYPARADDAPRVLLGAEFNWVLPPKHKPH